MSALGFSCASGKGIEMLYRTYIYHGNPLFLFFLFLDLYISVSDIDGKWLY